MGDLADVLVDAVHGGASVGFVLPFDLEDATAYWRRVLRDVEAGAALLIGSFAGDRVDGTV